MAPMSARLRGGLTFVVKVYRALLLSNPIFLTIVIVRVVIGRECCERQYSMSSSNEKIRFNSYLLYIPFRK